MDKARKRQERSLAFFAEKKSGKYKRQKVDGNETTAASRTPIAVDAKFRFCINFILTDCTFILTDQFTNIYPGAIQFVCNLKKMFLDSNVIMFLQNKHEINLCRKVFSLIPNAVDLFIDCDIAEGGIVPNNERPLLYLRKCLAKQMGPPALAGPNVLLTRTMNANNNRQYDIVKDIRRFYIFENNILSKVDYNNLLHNVQNDLQQFFS